LNYDQLFKSISAAGEESNTGRMEIDEKKYVETLDEEEEESELNTSVDEEDDIEDEEEEEIKDGNEEDQEVEAAVASILTGKRSGCIADNNKNDNREMVGDKSINNIIKIFFIFPDAQFRSKP
jgi:hypothetical protein